MAAPADPFAQLLEAHLAGTEIEVPPAYRGEFAQALAAHGALCQFLDETLIQDHDEVALPPDVSQEYDITRELGRGGMGVVFLARQRSLNRLVALKVLRLGERAAGSLLKRFQDEAQHLARLRHPHIVSIHEVGDTAGGPYFTMDFIDGEPLSTVLARGPLPPSQALAVFRQIAEAVQHAHRQGIVHRDLKPGNVLVDKSGHVFVTDFGLARNVAQESSITQTGELLGTPQYMSPEQARGDSAAVGEATDIHALGLLLFEMLTGRPAFAAMSPVEVLVKLLHEDPPALRSLDRRIPRDLETICLKLLGKSPAARYANVSAVLEDVRRYEAGEPLLARRTSVLALAMRWAARHWKLAATALVTAAVVAMVVPPLLDKSYEELVIWGDEELASGHPDVAAQVYARALRRATDAQRPALVNRIVHACRDMTDAQEAVGLALQVVELAPAASFGKHDYLVAQALVTRERLQSPSGTIDIWHTKPDPILKLIKSRLELALRGRLPADQQLVAEETLAAVQLALSAERAFPRVQPEYLHTLPTGSAAELKTQLADDSQPIWNRARAAIALGRLYERQFQRPEAVSSFRQAYELVRSVYPMYSGVKVAIGAKLSRVDAPDAEECRLVRQLVQDLRRLSPASLPEPRGELQFDVEGFELPETISLDFSLELCDPSVQDPHRGLPHHLPRLVPLRRDAPVRVQVLDGEYRLRYRGHHARWDREADDLARLIQVDTDDWPQRVTIQGDVVELPPVRLRLAQEVKLTSPLPGAHVDLNDAELVWDAVAGASRYRLTLMYTAETPSPTTTMFLAVETDQARLRLAELAEPDQARIRENLTTGRTAGWKVEALDERGRQVGVTLTEYRFLVTQELAKEK